MNQGREGRKVTGFLANTMEDKGEMLPGFRRK
jgi:hypothetical protein